ncbi:MAG: hypothetical protein BWY77_00215 [bacterium ADurb.Bin431]|nr:MAG: hypothetical protein BWY77_00215 [bacterium ADurb.Bin431]
MGGIDLHKDLVDFLQVLGGALGLNGGGLIGKCGDNLDILRDLAGDIDVQTGIYLQAAIVADGDAAGDAAVLVELGGVIDLTGAALPRQGLARGTGRAKNPLYERMALFDGREGKGIDFVLQADVNHLRYLLIEADLALEIIHAVLLTGQGLVVEKDPFGA